MATPYANALSFCRPRCSSTFCPTNIAALLRPAPLSSSSQKPPADGDQVMVNGFVRTVRKQKRIAFTAIGDGSTLQTVQAVMPPHLAEGFVKQLQLSTSLRLTNPRTWIDYPLALQCQSEANGPHRWGKNSPMRCKSIMFAY